MLEQFATPAQLWAVHEWTSSVVLPHGSLAQTLAEAGIERASAIVCVVSRDLSNMQIALQARHMSPDVRVVSQLGNVAVRRAMTVDNGPGAVIDGASLASPAIVEACLGRRQHTITIGAQTFVAATVPVEGGTLRSAFGDLAPLAVQRPDLDGSSTVFACPGRDFVTVPGDEATVLGTPAEIAMRGIGQAQSVVPVRATRPGPSIAGLVLGLRSAMREQPGLFRALGVLAALVTVSTVLLRVGYANPGMSGLDALYFSVETVATVGFGDFNFSQQDWWLRVWAIFLMLGGITTTAVLMAYVADLLISRRLDHSAGRRRARRMTGHVIVVGLGAFGLEVASGLIAAGKQVVVIERDQRTGSSARRSPSTCR